MNRCLLLVSVVAFAAGVDESLSQLKLTRPSFESSIAAYTQREVPESDRRLAIPYVEPASRALLKGLNDASRAAMVKELGLAAKAIVMSPAFETAYNALLQKDYNAINHGIKVVDTEAVAKKAAEAGDYSALGNAMRDQMRKMVFEQVKQADQATPQVLPILAESIKGLMSSLEPANASEKAMHKRAAVALDEAAKLSPSNLNVAREKFREGAYLAVFVEPKSAGSSEADAKKNEQQLNYNRRALRPNLKAKLTAFVALAKSVDHKAITQPKDNRVVFANPAYEKQSSFWKLLFRLGPGGTSAAMQIAQAWSAEL